MSMEIDGLESLLPSVVSRSAAVSAGGGATATAEAGEQDAVDVAIGHAVPHTPPRAVLQDVARAGNAYQQLWSIGTHVHFIADAAHRTVTIQVQDLHGNTLGTISPSETLRLAAGEGLS